MREDLYLHTLKSLGYGETVEEMSVRLNACIQAAKHTGKAAELTLTLKIKPKAAGTQVFIEEVVKEKIPKFDREETILFTVTHEDGSIDLVRNDPKQESIPGMRIVESDRPSQFKTVGENQWMFKKAIFKRRLMPEYKYRKAEVY